MTQTLAAASDTLFKTAATMMAVYAAGASKAEGGLVPALVWALYMAPYVLFAALSGQVADKFEKSRVIRQVKLLELAVFAVAAAAFFARSIPLVLVAVFLKGIASAFFSPVKYAALPEHLQPRELATGYSLVEAGSFVACLAGTLAGTLLMPLQNGAAATSAALALLGVAGVLSAVALPRGRAAAPDLQLDPHMLRPLAGMVRLATADRFLLNVMIGRSLFWLTGALFLAEIPAVTRHVLAGTPEVVALVFTLFSVGLSAGMLGYSKFMAGEEAARHVWLPGLLVSGFTLDMCLAAARLAPSEDLLPLGAFLADPARLRIAVDLTLAAVFCGAFVVPLGVSLQTRPAEDARARVVSVDNALSSLVMVVGMAAAGLAVAAGASLLAVFVGFAVLNAATCLYLQAGLRREAVTA
ncbi:MFS transporter [Phenylobacterium sp. LjRoot219]|uniref:MFS transporter n=1 Tax=Phenylobacterium sp. LjRoot219 TaxID=3342283 RepID=UPI003ED16C83